MSAELRAIATAWARSRASSRVSTALVWVRIVSVLSPSRERRPRSSDRRRELQDLALAAGEPAPPDRARRDRRTLRVGRRVDRARQRIGRRALRDVGGRARVERPVAAWCSGRVPRATIPRPGVAVRRARIAGIPQRIRRAVGGADELDDRDVEVTDGADGSSASCPSWPPRPRNGRRAAPGRRAARQAARQRRDNVVPRSFLCPDPGPSTPVRRTDIETTGSRSPGGPRSHPSQPGGDGGVARSVRSEVFRRISATTRGDGEPVPARR